MVNASSPQQPQPKTQVQSLLSQERIFKYGLQIWSTFRGPLGYEDPRCLANRPCNYFPRFRTTWFWSTNVTNGQRDDMQSQDRALHHSPSRGKKGFISLGFVYEAILRTRLMM